LDRTILYLGLHILLPGLHRISWIARLEYALELSSLAMSSIAVFL